MDYHSKDIQDSNDTEYLLQKKPKGIQSTQKSKHSQIESIHEPQAQDYHLHNNKEIEITPMLKEDYTLLTLNNISHCQSCKEKFNSNRNAPYLLPCNHFFCKKCIEGFSTGSYAINCPIDGKVANSFSELTLLANLLDKGEVSDVTGEHCNKHPNQKLTHFVEETKEVICVYCALNVMKANPLYHLTELDEKCNQLTAELDKMLESNQQYAEGLQGALDAIKKNKETVDEQIVQFYDRMTLYLIEKKEELLKQTESVFGENAFALSEKLDFFSKNIELAEKAKEKLNETKNSLVFSQAVDKYEKVINEANNSSKLSLIYKELKLSIEEEKKMTRTIANLTQLTSQGAVMNFGDEIKASPLPTEQSLTQKRRAYKDELYLDTSNDKPSKPYLAPEAICRTFASHYTIPSKKLDSSTTPTIPISTQKPKPKQYISSTTTATRNASFGTKSQIGFSHSRLNNNQGLSLEYDYRKKQRDLSFDKYE